MGIGVVVGDLVTYVGVFAFSIGLMLGFAVEPTSLRRRATAPAVAPVRSPVAAPPNQMTAEGQRAADEPMTAERTRDAAATAVQRTPAAEPGVHSPGR